MAKGKSVAEKLADAAHDPSELNLPVRRAVYRATVLGNAALILDESEYEKVGLGRPKNPAEGRTSEGA